MCAPAPSSTSLRADRGTAPDDGAVPPARPSHARLSPSRALLGLASLVLGCAVIVLVAHRLRAAAGDDLVRSWLVQESGFWLAALLVLAVVLLVERAPLSSIGLRPPTLGAIATGAAAYAFVMVAAAAIAVAVERAGLPLPHEPPGLRQLPLWMLLLVALRAGFLEEVMFRGYLLERLGLLTGSRLLGAGLSLVLFAAAHVPGWGAVKAVPAALLGAGLTWLYMRRGNLWAPMVAHWLIDGTSVVLLAHGAA